MKPHLTIGTKVLIQGWGQPVDGQTGVITAHRQESDGYNCYFVDAETHTIAASDKHLIPQ